MPVKPDRLYINKISTLNRWIYVCVCIHIHMHMYTHESCIVMHVETLGSSNNSERKHRVPCRCTQRNVSHIQWSEKTSLMTSVDMVKPRKGKGKALRRGKIIWWIKQESCVARKMATGGRVPLGQSERKGSSVRPLFCTP